MMMELRRNWLFPLGVLGGILAASGAPLPGAALGLAAAFLLYRSGRVRFLPLLLFGLAAGWTAVLPFRYSCC